MFIKALKSLNEVFWNKERKICYYQDVRILDSCLLNICMATKCLTESFNKPCARTVLKATRKAEKNSHLNLGVSPKDYLQKPEAPDITCFLFTLKNNKFGKKMEKIH